MNNQENRVLHQTRIALGLTSAEAGQYVHVTRKTWENWEKMEANGVKPPQAKVELFFTKIENLYNNIRDRGRVVVVMKNFPNGSQYPEISVADWNYLGLDDDGGDTAIIKSMGIDINTGRTCVYRTRFEKKGNEHVLRFCEQCKPAHE